MNNILKTATAAVLIFFSSTSIVQAKTLEQVCADFKNHQKSIAACDKIISSKKYSKKRKANALVNKCAALGTRKDYDASISACQKAIEFNPGIRMAHSNIAWAYGEKGDKSKAIQFYKRELGTHPNNKTALNDLCFYLRNSNKQFEAISYCRKVLNIDPKYKWSYYNLAQIYKGFGYFKSASDHFKKFIELARSENKDDTNAYTASNEVAVLEAKLESFQADVRTDAPADVAGHVDWKICLERSAGVSADQKLEACERIVLRPKWVKPDSGGWANTGKLGDVFVARAEARADLKQHGLSLLDYELLLSVSPKSPEALIGRATSKEALGNLRSAAKDIKAALLLLPSTDPRQPELRKQLENLEYKIKISDRSVQKKNRAGAKKTTKRRAKARRAKKNRPVRRKSRSSGRLKSYAEAYRYCRKRYGRGNVQTVRKRNGKYICHLHAYSPNE